VGQSRGRLGVVVTSASSASEEIKIQHATFTPPGPNCSLLQLIAPFHNWLYWLKLWLKLWSRKLQFSLKKSCACAWLLF
jgi:hypothetical protein